MKKVEKISEEKLQELYQTYLGFELELRYV